MSFTQRMRRLAPGLIGSLLAATLLWGGGAMLEHEVEQAQPFMLRVAEPAEVFDLEAHAGGLADTMQWRGRVTPASERRRVELSIDGVPTEARGDPDTGELLVPLTQLRGQPGWHFIEVGLDRRGGRSEWIVDPVLVGWFATQSAQEPEKPCVAALSASPALVESLLVGMLEREVLPVLRANEHMGPDTELSEAKLELRDDALRFELELSGVNTLAVSGVILVAVVDERRLFAKLTLLSEVDFRGKLRNQARGIGAGGGALLGGLILGPLAPVGAVAGWFLADKVVTRKARDLVHEQIEAGLAKLDDVDLLPTHIELIPGQPDSRAAVGFCDQTRVRATGLDAGLWIIPEPANPRFDLGVTGPLVTGAAPTLEPLGPHEDLRVELSIDLINALLTQWTASGLLAELLGERRAIEHANIELEPWTPLRLAGLRPTRPPTLTPIGGPSDGWAFGIGGLAIDLTGIDDDEQPWGHVYVGAAGTVSPIWDPVAGSLGLAGSLDRLEIGCVRPAGSGRPGEGDEQPLALHGCFSELLEAVELQARLDQRLRSRVDALPGLAIRELLAEQVGLEIDELVFSRPRGGVLRLSASSRQ